VSRDIENNTDIENNYKQSKKKRILMQNEVHGGSKAIWPTPVRSCVATDKAAQRRRLFIMTGGGWLALLRMRCSVLRHLLHALATMPRALQVRVAFIVGGCTLLLVLLFHWDSLLNHRIVFAAFAGCCVLFVLVAAYLKFDHQRVQRQRPTAIEKFAVPETQAAVTQSIAAGVPGAHLGFSLRALTRNTQVQQPTQFITSQEAATPAAAPPLVRVLETVDLSSVNVPHFIDTTSFKALAASALKHIDTSGHQS
jgi:hypothetical protein